MKLLFVLKLLACRGISYDTCVHVRACVYTHTHIYIYVFLISSANDKSNNFAS